MGATMIGMLNLRPSITRYGLAGDSELCNKINDYDERLVLFAIVVFHCQF